MIYIIQCCTTVFDRVVDMTVYCHTACMTQPALWLCVATQCDMDDVVCVQLYGCLHTLCFCCDSVLFMLTILGY